MLFGKEWLNNLELINFLTFWPPYDGPLVHRGIRDGGYTPKQGLYVLSDIQLVKGVIWCQWCVQVQKR